MFSKVHEIVPVSKIVVEVASFDIQNIKKPTISGSEYQQGKQLVFWNVREYVLLSYANAVKVSIMSKS